MPAPAARVGQIARQAPRNRVGASHVSRRSKGPYAVFVVRLFRSLLAGIWATLKPALTFVAWMLAVIAAVALVNDVTLWQLSDGPFVAMGLRDHWTALAPASHQAFTGLAEQSLPGPLWPFLQSVFALPVWLSLGVLTLLLFALTRNRRSITVFAN